MAATEGSRSVENPLSMFTEPKTIACIGATERPNSVGRLLVWNIVSSPCGATFYPVNPSRKSVLGIKAYASIRLVPEQIDLAIIALPAHQCPEALRECIESRVKGCIIVSAGFKEQGPEGAEIEKKLISVMRSSHDRKWCTRVLGPNSLGIIMPWARLNASIAWSGVPKAGSVALVSQSGALANSLLDWCLKANVGLSTVFTIGTAVDVNWADALSYVASDRHTRSILLYMESIGDSKAFMSAARSIARDKPIVVFKAGQTEAGREMAASHTGNLIENNEVLDAAFRRCGVLRVQYLEDLFGLSGVLSNQPRCHGNRMAIISNAGGPAVIATDALISHGGRLASVSKETAAVLQKLMPAQWSGQTNPLHLYFDADPERYAAALETVLADSNVDGVLVVAAAQPGSDPTAIARKLLPVMSQVVRKDSTTTNTLSSGDRSRALRTPNKPVIGCWFGGKQMADGGKVLTDAGVPMVEFPDHAARMFCEMWQYSCNLRLLHETPALPPDTDLHTPDRDKVAQIIACARKTGRRILTEVESKAILDAYGIPCVPTVIATTVEEAVGAADSIGYPVVLKTLSYSLAHKSTHGRVRLHLYTREAVARAFAELTKPLPWSAPHTSSSPFGAGVTVTDMDASIQQDSNAAVLACCELDALDADLNLASDRATPSPANINALLSNPPSPSPSPAPPPPQPSSDLDTTTKRQDANSFVPLQNSERIGRLGRCYSHFEESGEILGVSVQKMVGVGHSGEDLQGYEIIIGSSTDAQFGPVLLFGAGGVHVEVQKDRSIGLPPLNTTLARRMMERTRLFNALRGQVYQRRSVNLSQLEQTMVRFSQLVIEQFAQVQDIDINPILLSLDGSVTALDARFVLHPVDPVTGNTLTPLPNVAIRPYPLQYIWEMVIPSKPKAASLHQPHAHGGALSATLPAWSKFGKDPSTPLFAADPSANKDIRLLIRPIQSEDEPLLVQFNHKLSERSVYLRYFHPISLQERISHERLNRLCYLDYDREIALVAVVLPSDYQSTAADYNPDARPRRDSISDERANLCVSPVPKPTDVIAGICRMIKFQGHNGLWEDAEFGITVADPYQHRGLGTHLLVKLLGLAVKEGVKRLHAEILVDNHGMRRLCEKLGFTVHFSPEIEAYVAFKDLENDPSLR
eukprot:CAMPEP_0184369414 /NCGR_PEP_ID=MMETSP1089-20130417/162233_1 /TAXON_ID=38269 ORGANISM="Gloeochaete wittrockiana, Strain SAG46.84" /NCGR_SAMPLE_ID=MMETSP1089 /ASSEMBLY_ACC=CAM_ASM_000445 /LENGTH=1149 /DNA_ID=CAMNT_0026711857 /DNA_START=88 /DNA_END=3537 /DNA_ORIENTATION=-